MGCSVLRSTLTEHLCSQARHARGIPTTRTLCMVGSDDLSVLGPTLDDGQFGFMKGFHPGHLCNHSDHRCHYANDNQPQIGRFNLSCFAQAILPLLQTPFDEHPPAWAGQVAVSYSS